MNCRWLAGCVFVFFLFWSQPGRGAILPDSELWVLFVEQAGQADINPLLIMAISKHESNYHPWALNIAGKSYKPGSRGEALRLIRKAMASGRSFDIGLMQINNWWLRRLKLTPEQILEPRNNVLVGAMILRQEIRKYGLTWRAIAAYHTPPDRNPGRGKAYAQNVLSHLRRIIRYLDKG